MSNPTIYPYAVCTACSWTQMHHAGSLRASKAHAFDHKQTTGHETRIKTEYEPLDALWSALFNLHAYGENALYNWLTSTHLGRPAYELVNIAVNDLWNCACTDDAPCEAHLRLATATRIVMKHERGTVLVGDEDALWETLMEMLRDISDEAEGKFSPRPR